MIAVVYSFPQNHIIYSSFIPQILSSTYNVPDIVLGAGLQLQKIKANKSLFSWKFVFQGDWGGGVGKWETVTKTSKIHDMQEKDKCNGKIKAKKGIRRDEVWVGVVKRF